MTKATSVGRNRLVGKRMKKIRGNDRNEIREGC